VHNVEPEIKSCVLTKFAINGFSVKELGADLYEIRPRGMELQLPNTYMWIREVKEGLIILNMNGTFRGSKKKTYMQQNIDTWVAQCKASMP